MIRHIATVVAVGAVVFALIQLIPISLANPSVTHDVAAPAPVESILRRDCYDCHSNQTRWPWYAHVAPISWMVIRDIDNGRRHLNFSNWERYADDPETEISKLKNIDQLCHRGKMPPWYYLSAHPEARLSSNDREILDRWTTETIAHEEKLERSHP
jgi:hypothetical protein